MQSIHKVIDETGAIHSLVKRIGAGSQGEVWLTEGGRRIVKLLNRNKDAESFRRQLSFVRRLDLSGLHVARPIAVLKPPHVGYVAEFLSEMVPIKTLLEAPLTDLLRWHISSGGLRRRLRLLAHIGEVLTGLNGRGVIYSDVSHHNIFISKNVEAVEAWLIDLDNLSHESDLSRAIYTPGYGAPEVVTATAGCTSFSDAWSFAVLVWQTLTLTHPFVGNFVNDGEPELEEQAFSGKLPWVGHSLDNRNVCSTGLPPKIMLTSHLADLARRTFEDGLVDRKKRPSVSEWVDRLHSAADQTVICPNCRGTYIVTEFLCPFCDERRPVVTIVQIKRWQPGRGVVEGALRIGQLPLTENDLYLSRRITQGETGINARRVQIQIRPVHRGISVRVMPGCEAWVAPIANAQVERYPVSEREKIVPSNGWMVFFEEPDRPQRVAILGRSS